MSDNTITVNVNNIEYKNHWENVFINKDTTKVSWYQDKPITSLNLIHDYTHNLAMSTIDVGGGDSILPDSLLDAAYQNVTVLDISKKAIEVSQNRMGIHAKKVQWIESNILAFEPTSTYDLWHDRAVFHFIISSAEKQKYKEVVLRALAPDGVLIIAAFSKNGGPTKCSDLEVSQHDQDSLMDLFVPEFKLINSFENIHQTPSGSNHNFYWIVLKRKQ